MMTQNPGKRQKGHYSVYLWIWVDGLDDKRILVTPTPKLGPYDSHMLARRS